MTAILLLDLHARNDAFVTNDAFGSLAARLTAAGHTVTQQRLVAAEARDAAAFLAAISAAAGAVAAQPGAIARAAANAHTAGAIRDLSSERLQSWTNLR